MYKMTFKLKNRTTLTLSLTLFFCLSTVKASEIVPFNVSAENLNCHNSTLHLKVKTKKKVFYFSNHTLKKKFDTRKECFESIVELIGPSSPYLKMDVETVLKEENGFREYYYTKGNCHGTHGCSDEIGRINTLTTIEELTVYYKNFILKSLMSETKDLTK
jgi:hypothetical protein